MENNAIIGTETEMSAPTLQMLYANKTRLNADLATLTTNYKKAVASFQSSIDTCDKLIALTCDGLDIVKITHALHVLEIRGTYTKGGQDRRSVVLDAIEWFSTGKVLYNTTGEINHYKNLFDRYFGTKNYDGWYGQREDHPYFMGPRHGSTIFSIGVARVHRERYYASAVNGQPRNYTFTPYDIESVLYYLTNIEKIETAEASANTLNKKE